MKIRALISFSGNISMCKGEERECSNKAILSDLLKAGYIEEVKKGDKNEGKSNKKR